MWALSYGLAMGNTSLSKSRPSRCPIKMIPSDVSELDQGEHFTLGSNMGHLHILKQNGSCLEAAEATRKVRVRNVPCDFPGGDFPWCLEHIL